MAAVRADKALFVGEKERPRLGNVRALEHRFFFRFFLQEWPDPIRKKKKNVGNKSCIFFTVCLCTCIYVYELAELVYMCVCVFIQRADLIEPGDGMPMTQTVCGGNNDGKDRSSAGSSTPQEGGMDWYLKPKTRFKKECASYMCVMCIYIYIRNNNKKKE